MNAEIDDPQPQGKPQPVSWVPISLADIPSEQQLEEEAVAAIKERMTRQRFTGRFPFGLRRLFESYIHVVRKQCCNGGGCAVLRPLRMLVVFVCLAALAGGWTLSRGGWEGSGPAPPSEARWELGREDGELALRRGDEHRLILAEASRDGFELPSANPAPPMAVAEIIIGMLFPDYPIGYLFWPAIVIAMAASVYGIARRRPLWLLLGALLTMPFTLYFLATPRFRGLAVFLPLLLVLAALALFRQRPWLAWVLLAPYAAFFGWLAWQVINQWR